MVKFKGDRHDFPGLPDVLSHCFRESHDARKFLVRLIRAPKCPVIPLILSIVDPNRQGEKALLSASEVSKKEVKSNEPKAEEKAESVRIIFRIFSQAFLGP